MRLFPPSFVSQRQLIQFNASLTPARIFLFKDRDKSIAVSWLNEMNHFMDHNILNQVFRLLHKLSIESDVSGLAMFRTLPAVPYDACAKWPTQVSSLSLVRYRNNDYSVPVAYGHRNVMVKGYVDRIDVHCGSERIAQHERSYRKDDFVFEPRHYLALLERKLNALDQAAPLAQWILPEVFYTLRRLLEARMGTPGKREYVQVLRLLEQFTLDEMMAAVHHAVALGAIGFDAVKHLLLCRIEHRPPRLTLAIFPYLPRAVVKTTAAQDYLTLLKAAA
jgi:hypothetical protein